MVSEFIESQKILRDYLAQRNSLLDDEPNDQTADKASRLIDRPQVVAHATLSALSHHWPSQFVALSGSADLDQLLDKTLAIKTVEHSRWVVQRRIAIAKIHRFFELNAPF